MRLILAVLALIAVILVGTAGYMVIEEEQQLSVLDALYMTVITVSTVGYKEAFPLSRGGQIWTILIITFGVGTVTYAFSSVVSLAVSGDLRSERARKKMDLKINRLQGHVIICGYGRMGQFVMEELRKRKVPIVIVEIDPGLEGQLQESDTTYVIGDATEEETLFRAGVTRARSLVTGLPSDADNVYITLTAHALCPDLQIVSRAEQPSTQDKLLRAGANKVVCPQVIGATKIANILTRPSVVDFVEIADQGVDLEIDEYVLGKNSPLVGRTLIEASIREKFGATVVAVKRADGEALVTPDPHSVLAVNDTLILVGAAGISQRLSNISR